MKKYLAAMVGTFVALMAHAADFSVNGVTYKITDSKGLIVEVVAGTQKYSGTVIIPATVAFDEKTYKVKAIGQSAFNGCTDLEKVVIGENVEEIAYRAFYNCNNLTDINWSNNIRSYGADAFNGCSALTYAELSASLESMNSGVFHDCIGITSIKINEGCGVIGVTAFAGCTKLQEVTIPNSVTTMGNSAFNGCTALTQATVGNGLKKIDQNTFSGCTNLETVVIGSAVEEIAYRAFYHCNHLTDINWSNNIRSYGADVFNGCTALTYAELSASLESMNSGVFKDCIGITSIKINDGCAAIGVTAFSGCTKLQEVTIPNSVTTMGNSAFNGCTALTQATVGNGIMKIDASTFSGCNRLETVSLGNMLSEVAYRAFYNCSSLSTITVKSIDVPSTGSDAFNSFTATLYVPSEALNDYKNHATWGKFNKILPTSDKVYLIISQTESGSIKIPVTKATRYALVIEAAAGWKVNSVTFNDIDVTAELDNGTFTTPSMVEDATIRVAYEAVSDDIATVKPSRMKVFGTAETIVVRGAEKGELVSVYATDGVRVGSSVAGSGDVNIRVKSGATYIVKVGTSTLKVAL